MAEDEFFKRIAETEQPTELPPSARPIGTATRRGLSLDAGKSAQPARAKPEEQDRGEGQDGAAVDGPTGSSRLICERCGESARRVLGRIKANRARIAAVAAAGLGLGFAAAIVVVALHSAGGGSASTAEGGEADRLLSQLAAVKADQRAMNSTLARERAASQLELQRLAHAEQRGRSKHDSAESDVAAVAVAPVAQATSTGTQESFGFERPSP
jgi:hypothetical protein